MGWGETGVHATTQRRLSDDLAREHGGGNEMGLKEGIETRVCILAGCGRGTAQRKRRGEHYRQSSGCLPKVNSYGDRSG